MNIQIGSLVTNDTALGLCRLHSRFDLATRIESHPELYRSWIFDGVSGLPDWIFGWFGDRTAVTYCCALPHDLDYAYGNPGDSRERKLADQTFYQNLVNLGKVNPLIAKICYYVVRVLGNQKFGTSYSWGFANRRVGHLSETPLPWTY